jgi:hypothetical protein
MNVLYLPIINSKLYAFDITFGSVRPISVKCRIGLVLHAQNNLHIPLGNVKDLYHNSTKVKHPTLNKRRLDKKTKR